MKQSSKSTVIPKYICCLQDSYGCDENRKGSGLYDQRNVMTRISHYDVMSYSLNDVMTSHGDKCLQRVLFYK